MKLLITGGAGFIGSALVRKAVSLGHKVLNIDKLTYAGNLESLDTVQNSPNYFFEKVDICDSQLVQAAFSQFQPDAVLNLAAESHVDRSIDSPSCFIQTNVLGTYTLLEAARLYISKQGYETREKFRFIHVSTDEVYGSIEKPFLFTEATPYQPNSPYSASKASSDHLVRAWHKTYDFPSIITNCSNNYGPYQFPEKLIPLMTLNCLEGKDLPVYGTGKNVRDWLFVDDHVEALLCVLSNGKVGEVYNIGGHNEVENLSVVRLICELIDELRPDLKGPHERLIKFVEDRPGHDERYAIDSTKISKELGWVPKETFESGLRKTICWYIDNQAGWAARVLDGTYSRERLGRVPS